MPYVITNHITLNRMCACARCRESTFMERQKGSSREVLFLCRCALSCLGLSQRTNMTTLKLALSCAIGCVHGFTHLGSFGGNGCKNKPNIAFFYIILFKLAPSDSVELTEVGSTQFFISNFLKFLGYIFLEYCYF